MRGERHVSLRAVDRWYDEPVVQLGRLAITRRELIEHGCGNLKAAKNLGRVVRELGFDSPKDLFRLGPWGLLDETGCGVFTVFAAMHVLDLCGLKAKQWANTPAENGAAKPKNGKG